jgi:23S rRNA-/tRNA-specific pseudouridylate synthase
MSKDPYIIKEYDDVYFVYKPPYWDCTTEDKDLQKFIKNYKGKNLFVKWLVDNINAEKSIRDCKDCNWGLLNRLDKETSGIVMVAKNLDSYKKYRQNINDHKKTTKIYLTLVEGKVQHKLGIITLPLATDKRTNKTYVDEDNGKYSYTEYINIAEMKYDNKKYTLLAVKIRTGRTHQIRVHLQSIGHIVFCDKKYQQNRTELHQQCNVSKRLFLHATYYRLTDNKGESSELPEDLKNTLDKMKITRQNMLLRNAIDILKSDCISQTIDL